MNTFQETIPKDFVSLDLTSGDSTTKGFCKPRTEQDWTDFQRVLRQIFRKVQRRAQKDGWQYIVYVSISREHLSDDSTEYNPCGELGESKSRLCAWHCHLIFYSPKHDMKELLHIANVARRHWVSNKKGCYNVGSDRANRNAKYCDIGKYYYASIQAEHYMLLSHGGASQVDYFRLIVKEAYDKLTETQKKYIDGLVSKWTRRHQEIELLKSD